MYKLISIIILSLLAFFSCNRAPANKNAVVTPSEAAQIEDLLSTTQIESKSILKTNCYTCHSPNSASHDDILAPPLVGIKHKYKKLYPDRISFISRMSEFINAPTTENAVMKGPVRHFGLMPNSALSKDEIIAISAYIYDNQIEAPAWFAKHFEEKNNSKWSQ